MKRNILRVLTLVLVFAILIPSASMIGDERSEDEAIAARVMFPGPGSTSLDYADYVERVIAPYDGFVMAELNQKQRDYLESQGAIVIREANLRTIGIDGYVFDTRFGEPLIKDALRAKPRAGYETSYLVQFVGPIKNEWQTTLLSMGANPISYYPFNTILVKATPEIKASLGGLNIIQWVGDYHPAYKIRPVLTELDKNEKREVKIITYEPDGVGAVLSVMFLFSCLWMNKMVTQHKTII